MTATNTPLYRQAHWEMRGEGPGAAVQAPAKGGKNVYFPTEPHPFGLPDPCCDVVWDLNPALEKTGHSSMLDVMGKLKPRNEQF